jgi:hypothetical protein
MNLSRACRGGPTITRFHRLAGRARQQEKNRDTELRIRKETAARPRGWRQWRRTRAGTKTTTACARISAALLLSKRYMGCAQVPREAF